MPVFDLTITRTNRPGLVPYTGGPLASPYRPIVPSPRTAANIGAIGLATNAVLPALTAVTRQWPRPQCSQMSPSDLAGAIEHRGPTPAEWIETGAGIAGTWGTVRLVSLATAVLGGAAVPPTAFVVAGGVTLAAWAANHVASRLRQVAIAQQQNEIQLAPTSQFQYVDIDGGQCIYELPPSTHVQRTAECEAVLAVPEWWAVRPGADRRQLSVLCRGRLNGRTVTRVTTIPHYSGPDSLNSPPIPAHTRGRWLTEVVLLDNSRIRIFADSADEGKRVLLSALQWVEPAMVPNNPMSTIEVKEMKRDDLYNPLLVTPFRAILWRRGQRSAAIGERPIIVWDERL